MVRVVLAEAATSFLKFIIMPFYAAWAVKLGVIDSNTHPLFAIAMVALSIYGLWILLKGISDYVDRTASQYNQVATLNFDADHDASP